jgi:hypothetical protein
MDEHAVPLLLVPPKAAKLRALPILVETLAVELSTRGQGEGELVSVPPAPLGKIMASR